MTKYSDFESWFSEVLELATEMNITIEDKSEFDEYYMIGLEPDDALNQWQIGV